MWMWCRAAAILLLCLSLGACAWWGEPLRPRVALPGAPNVSEVLRDLAANDAAVQNFRAGGTFTFISPEVEGAVRGRGRVVLERPDKLHVSGRHRVTGVKVFELTCVGQEFLLEFPTEDLRYYQLQGEPSAGMPFPVLPTAIAGEMFFPEPWRDRRPRRVQLVGYQQSTGEAVLQIDLPKRRQRRIVVAGPPWVLVRSELLDEHGNVTARTMLSGYRDLDGIRFPTRVEAEFPREQTRMIIAMHNIRINTHLEYGLFQIKRLPSCAHSTR